MTLTLLLLIRKIYHVYIDDIVIWSSSIEEYMNNIQRVLQALRKAQLYCSPKKTKLFALEINSIKHIILAKGICIDCTKINYRSIRRSFQNGYRNTKTHLKIKQIVTGATFLTTTQERTFT